MNERATIFRVGQGFDIHRFDTSGTRRLVLGGVVFDDHPGLVGHSDGDAIAHACTDALLGAAGLGDIGEWFPDTDDSLAGADSIELLGAAAEAVAAAGWSVGNIDTSVICESPKIAPQRAAMQDRLSEAVGAPVTVKGRRAEGLGAIGRRDGLVVFASAILVGIPDLGSSNDREVI